MVMARVAAAAVVAVAAADGLRRRGICWAEELGRGIGQRPSVGVAAVHGYGSGEELRGRGVRRERGCAVGGGAERTGVRMLFLPPAYAQGMRAPW